MQTIDIKCKTCNKNIAKPKNEIDRQKRRGRTEFYCSLSCAGKNKKNISHLKKFQNNLSNIKYKKPLDEYSDFRWYMKNIIKNSKKKNEKYDIDLVYLKELWNQQNGICPITKQKLELRNYTFANISHPYSASLDRIDNDKGYIKGNVRFVSLIFNYARNVFQDTDVIDFCKKVVDNNYGFLEKMV